MLLSKGGLQRRKPNTTSHSMAQHSAPQRDRREGEGVEVAVTATPRTKYLENNVESHVRQQPETWWGRGGCSPLLSYRSHSTTHIPGVQRMTRDTIQLKPGQPRRANKIHKEKNSQEPKGIIFPSAKSLTVRAGQPREHGRSWQTNTVRLRSQPNH